MFKKKKIKAKERLRKTRVDDEEDEASAAPTSGETNGAQEETSAMEAILQVKKKRKLLQSVQFKRGLDAAATIQAPAIAAGDDEPHQAGQNKDLEERLKGSFSGGTGGDFSSGNGVMERKHKAAMEEFIRQHLDSKDAAAAAEANIDGAREPSTVKELEKKLYQELASSAQTLAGTTLKGPMTVEGDVGSGGSMLGGTGIAEVSLPVDVRLKTVAETSAATSSARRLPSKDQAASKSAIAELPMSFAPGKGKRGKLDAVPMMKVAIPANGPTEPVHTTESEQIAKTASSAGHGVLSSDVSGVASSYSHNFRLHAQEWLQEKKDSERAPNEQIDEQSSAGGVDEDRIGFAAARGRGGDQSLDKAKGDSERQKRSSDDRVYKSFMTRQKEQRDRR